MGGLASYLARRRRHGTQGRLLPVITEVSSPQWPFQPVEQQIAVAGNCTLRLYVE